MSSYDAVVIGSGPNGLAAAIELATAGRSVRVIEGQETIGGGARTMELTRPGFRHDVCSAVHPLGLGSPFFRRLPLENHGLAWVQPPVPFAHALGPNEAVLVQRSVGATAAELGGTDGEEYQKRMESLLSHWDQIESHILGPPLRFPRHPLALARFGWVGVLPARTLIDAFTGERGRALMAGAAAHAYLPFNRLLGASFGLLYPVTAHRYGWPFAAGGSQSIIDALASHLISLGGEIETGRWVRSLRELPTAKVVLADLSPEVLAAVGGGALPQRYRRRLGRFRRAAAAFKVDYALKGPLEWSNPRLADAGTIHVGTAGSIAEGEAAIWKGRPPRHPFMLIAQPSRFDPARAPKGSHTLWVYAHVPYGSEDDYASVIESELEALAPGFRDLVLDRCVAAPADLEAYNPNYAGGDITGGAYTVSQTLFRPFPGGPYRTPLEGVYLCSASTPPGAGVHGMCGYWAARTVLRGELA
jgi:phytoene dehydrogenase-like protein